MYSKGILLIFSGQNAQSSSIFLGCLLKTLFFSRLQTFLIILMSGEFGGQFSRIFNPFSENQVFERIPLCAGALSCCNFSPKNISGNRLYCKTCKYLTKLIIPQTFWRHFRPSWALKLQSIIFFRQIFGFPINFTLPFRYWVNNGLILVFKNIKKSGKFDVECVSNVFEEWTCLFPSDVRVFSQKSEKNFLIW